MAKCGFPAGMMQKDAVGYRITPFSFYLGLAEIKALAADSGSTTVMDIPLRLMQGATPIATNFALGMCYVECLEAFTSGLTAKIVNEAGTLIAGASGGVALNGSLNVVPIAPIEAAAGTSYSEAYLRVTLAASNFASQTAGAFRFIGLFLTLPPRP